MDSDYSDESGSGVDIDDDTRVRAPFSLTDDDEYPGFGEGLNDREDAASSDHPDSDADPDAEGKSAGGGADADFVKKLVFTETPKLEMRQELDPEERSKYAADGDAGGGGTTGGDGGGGPGGGAATDGTGGSSFASGGAAMLLPSEDNLHRQEALIQRDVRLFQDEMTAYFRRLRSSDTRANRVAISDLAERQMRFLVEASIPADALPFFAEQLEMHNEDMSRFVWDTLTTQRQMGQDVVEQAVGAASARFEESLASMAVSFTDMLAWMRGAFEGKMDKLRFAHEKILDRAVRTEKKEAERKRTQRDIEYEAGTKALVQKYIDMIASQKTKVDTLVFEKGVSEQKRRKLVSENRTMQVKEGGSGTRCVCVCVCVLVCVDSPPCVRCNVCSWAALVCIGKTGEAGHPSASLPPPPSPSAHCALVV